MKTLDQEFDIVLAAKPAHEVGLARTKLEAAGIPSLERARGIDGDYIAPAGFLDLFVPKGARGRALAILAEHGDPSALSEEQLAAGEVDRGLGTRTAPTVDVLRLSGVLIVLLSVIVPLLLGFFG
jgi:hypothetical protein